MLNKRTAQSCGHVCIVLAVTTFALLLLLRLQVALDLLPICPMHQQQKPLLLQRLEQERAAAAGSLSPAVNPGFAGCA
jgi:hypothetical protein